MNHLLITIDDATIHIRADQIVATVQDGQGNVDIYIKGRELAPFKIPKEAGLTNDIINALWEEE